MTVVALKTRVQAAWEEYLAAKEKAERSGDMRDGIEAGRAWGRWLDLFTGGNR